MIGHPLQVLLILTLSLAVFVADADADADAHRAYYLGDYYNSHRFLRPRGRTRGGKITITIDSTRRNVAPRQPGKQHFPPIESFLDAAGGGRGVKEPQAGPPGGNDVPGGVVGEGIGPGLRDVVDVRTDLNVPNLPPGEGICPPVRLSCTVYRTREEECSTDADCGALRKCCFDICVQKDVCKSPVPDLENPEP